MRELFRSKAISSLAVSALLTTGVYSSNADALTVNKSLAIQTLKSQTPSSSKAPDSYDIKLEEAKNSFYELGLHCPTESRRPTFIFEERTTSTYVNSTLTVNAQGSSTRIKQDIKTGMDKWCVEKTGQKLKASAIIKPRAPDLLPTSTSIDSTPSTSEIASRGTNTNEATTTTSMVPKYKEGEIDILEWSRSFLTSLYYANPIAGGVPELREFETTGSICNPSLFYPDSSNIGGFTRYPGEVKEQGVICINPQSFTTEWGVSSNLSGNIAHEYGHLSDHQQGFYSPNTEQIAYTYQKPYIFTFADYCTPPDSGLAGCYIRYKNTVIPIRVDRKTIADVNIPFVDRMIATNGK